MVTQVAIGLVVEILEVVVGIAPGIHVIGQVAHIAFAPPVPGAWHVQPNHGIAASPVKPRGVKEQGAGIEALFRFLPVPFLQGIHCRLEPAHEFGGNGHGFRNPLGGEDPHQAGAYFLMGQPQQAFALLHRLVSQLGELIRHGGLSSGPIPTDRGLLV